MKKIINKLQNENKQLKTALVQAKNTPPPVVESPNNSLIEVIKDFVKISKLYLLKFS